IAVHASWTKTLLITSKTACGGVSQFNSSSSSNSTAQMQLHAANLDVHSCRRCVVCLSGEGQSAATLNSGKPKAAGFGERPPESRKGAAGGRKQKGKVDPRRQDFERVANYVRKAPPTEAEDYLTANLSAGLRYLLERPMPDLNDTPWSHLSADDVIYTQDSDPGQ
ncbi:hypothetical protein HaLaN_18299, partial [Haematococcus lacustris]